MSESDDPVIDEAKRIDDSLSKTFGFGEPSKERKEERHQERLADVVKSRGVAPTGPDLIRGFTGPDRKRRQQAASVLTRDWLPPTLGTPGLVGIG